MPNPFTVFTAGDNTTLTAALLAPNSGVTIDASSVSLHSSGQEAVNFYDGSLSALGIGAGLLLTTGTTPGTSNTLGWFGQDNSIYPDTYFNGDAAIDAVVNTVFQTQSFDATTLQFDFSVSDPAATSVSFDIVFGSDEYPEWVDQFVDCAVVMVNGVNYALFNHDPLHPLSVVSSNLAAGYFQDNNTDPATLPIEYDGVSHVLKIVAPINAGGVTNHIKIGIADTGDHIYDSGIFIANFSAGTIPGSGVVIALPGGGSNNNDSVTGSSADEYFNLLDGNDTVYAGGGDDIVVAGNGNDTVYGGSGNDEMKGDAGDDFFDGGDGLADTAVFAGASSAYSVSYSVASNSFTVTDSVTGAASEGTDTLVNVEFAKFSDGLFELGVNGLTSGSGSVPPPSANTPGMVVISGIGSVGNSLTATVSDMDGIAGSIGYQWQVSADNGASWSDISGAVNSSYLLSASDVGNLIQVTASYIDNGNMSESPVSGSKAVLAAKSGDLVVTLMHLDAPQGTSVINPLTTLLKNAIELGLTPNMAVLAIKSVLGIPAGVSLQSYDAYAVLQSAPHDVTALAVEKVAVQVAILTSLSDDDTGMNLTLAILNAAENNQTLDLANINDLCSILGVDPLGSLPNSLSVIYDRNKSISDALADGGGVSKIENEWVDLCGIQDGIASTSIADLSIHVNQVPVGSAVAELSVAVQNEIYIINPTSLLQGFSDPDGGVLQISDLAADAGGYLEANPDGTWSFIPFQDYSGPVELTYTIVDGQGGAKTATQLFVVVAAPPIIVNTLPTGEVVITGELIQGQPLLADTTTLADADGLGTFSYQWQANGVDIAGATESSFVPGESEVGSVLTVVVTYCDGNGTIESVGSSATDVVANVNDAPTGEVLLIGSAVEGQYLSVDSSTLADADGLGAIIYQWQADGVDIAGATSATLLPGNAEVGKAIAVVVTYTDGYGTIESVISSATDPVINVNDAPTGAVLVMGSAVEGQTLSVDSTTLADADGLGVISYQWQADGVDITGATAATLLLGKAQTGRAISVVATYTDGFGTIESPGSSATTPVLPFPGVTITGTAVADILNGGSGADTIRGLAGNDKLNGFAGNDTLDGGAGLDTMAGGLGDDTCVVDNTGDKVIENAGEGTDLVQVTIAAAGGTYTLASNVEQATLLNTVAFNLTGNALANVLVGNGAANILNGGAGADVMAGGGGDDTYVVDNVGDLVQEAANSGTDLVRVALAQAGGTYILTDNVENAFLSGTVSCNLTGNTFDNTLSGNAFDNTLTSGGGNDTLTGGQGIDTFVVDGGTVTITDLGNGADIVLVSAGATANATVSVAWTATSQSANYGTASITSNGLSIDLSAIVTGNGFRVTNTGKSVTLTGSALSDVLNGGVGKDTLLGGNGDDVLDGGVGIDTLSGGAGNDTFLFSTAPGKSNNDVITDFQSGSDKIKLLVTAFSAIKGGDGVFSSADLLVGTGVNRGTTVGGEHLIFNTANSTLYYDADGGGAGVGVQIATLSGVVAMDSADFIVI